MSLHLTEELLTADGFWGRRSQFSLRMWCSFLEVHCATVGGTIPMSIYARQIVLSGYLKIEDTKFRGVRGWNR